MPASKLSPSVELARTSGSDAFLPTAGIITTNNYWSANPYKPNRYNFIQQTDNIVNANLPTDINNLTTLDNIKPALNVNLQLAKPRESFIAKDFFGVARISPNSNVGAIEK